MSHIAIDARIISSSTGTYVLKLLQNLEQIDTKNTYTVFVPSKDLKYWVPKNPRFTLVPLDIKNYSFKEQTVFNQVLKQLKPDLVHFCMPQQPITYSGKSVTTVHDLTLLNTYNSDKNRLVYRMKQLVGRHVFKQIARTNEHIITPTQFTKDAYVAFSGIPESRVTVTYEAADIPKETKLVPYIHPYKKFILYVGQQSDYKNIKRLAAAHQQLLTTHPDLGLILVGKLNKSTQANKTFFESQGYRNILFTDFIPDEQRDWLMKHTEAYIFPSLMEGFGLPGLEAMVHGTPVVSSNATCLPEVYGDAAMYFDPTNVDDMAAQIERVITDTKLQKSLRSRGVKQAGKYSWERMARQTLAVYEAALTNSPEK